MSIKKLIGKVKCFFGIHELCDEEWTDSYGWGEIYLYSTNFCKRCNKIINKKLD